MTPEEIVTKCIDRVATLTFFPPTLVPGKLSWLDSKCYPTLGDALARVQEGRPEDGRIMITLHYPDVVIQGEEATAVFDAWRRLQ